MSLQLILKPQSYDGSVNGYSFNSTPLIYEYAADRGWFFTSIWTASQPSTITNPSSDAIDNAPSLVGGWRRFHTETGVFATAPEPDTYLNLSTLYFGIEFFSHATSDSVSGIYQTIENLVVGRKYDIIINKNTTTSAGYLGIGSLGRTDTLGGGYFNFYASNVNQITYTFTAAATSEIFVLQYQNNDGSSIKIKDVSIKDNVTTASLDVFDLSDGQVIADLYEEEEIPLSLSVDDFKNVSEKVQSYSKDFSLPATKRNNKIFSHLFDVTRVQDNFSFNPYKKTKCILKQDGLIIFEGFLQLIEIVSKDGESSYSVNIYSEAIVLAESLKDKQMQHIDFAELNHDYYAGNIINSWTGVLDLQNPLGSDSFAGALNDTTTDVLKYPFVNWVGLSLDGNNIELTRLEEAFRPFIKCKYLLDRIINEAGFTYESDFLTSDKFTKLFMDFNFGEGTGQRSGSGAFEEYHCSTNIPSTQAWKTIKMDTAVTQPFYYDGATGKYTSVINNATIRAKAKLRFKNVSAQAWTLKHRVLVRRFASGDTEVFESGSLTISSGHLYLWIADTTVALNIGDTIEFQFKTNTGNAGVFELKRFITEWTDYSWVIFITTSEAVTTADLVNNIRGELGQWDFVKGLMNMFNLVVSRDKDNPTNLLIEPYTNVFINNPDANTLDWTSKVDVSKVNLKPLELKKRLVFKYEDDEDDYALGVYKKATVSEYGSLEIDNSALSLLQGEEEIIASPFAPTIIKPLFQGYDSDFITPVIFNEADDGTTQAFDNLPRILYDNGVKTLNTGSYTSPVQNHTTSRFWQRQDFLQFSHLNEVIPAVGTEDYNFRTQYFVSQTLNVTPTDNLYSLYWSPYLDELYNVDTRTMTLQVNLSASDITNFNFYDKVVIRNREFRVNKIDYKPNGLSKVEFILIP